MIILCSTDKKVIQRWRDGLGNYDVAVACDRTELVLRLQEIRYGIVILHLKVQELDSPAAIADVIEKFPSIRIVACADVPDDDQGLAFLKVGVYGYCNTWMVPAQLTRVIELVEAEEVWVGRTLVLRLINNLPLAPAAGGNGQTVPIDLTMLSSRECEVANMVGRGLSNKRVADAMSITERTVKAHLSAIFRKTGCSDRIQLALLINQAGQPRS